MTAGHKHRTIEVREYGLIHLLLTRPTLHVSRNLCRVDKSRFVYGPVEDQDGCHTGAWRLSPLGLLHGLIGLTLILKEEED